MAGEFCDATDGDGRRCLLAHGHQQLGLIGHVFPEDRCGICSFTLAAHREQDLEKRRFGMCERGLEKKP